MEIMANFLALGVNFLAFLWKSFIIKRPSNIHPLATIHMINFLAVFKT